MKRREFLKAAGVGLTASAVAAPAIAQSMPELKWRLTSSFPKSLDTLYGAAEYFAKSVAEASDNKFQIQVFAAGEIVPALQAADAVTAGTVECCHTAAYYWYGKDPTWALFCAVPFGLNARQQNAWFYDGDGMKLLNEFGQKFNLYGLVGGNTGTQMGGWFRKEIKEPSDFQGLKFRIGGWAGKIIEKLGGVPQQIAGGDIYPALEKGTIDAAEWVGPYDDQKLGFNKIAPYYYYPGWWEGGPQTSAYVNITKWNELPKYYQSVIQAAAARAQTLMLAKYDAENPKALRELMAAGTKLLPYPQSVMEAAFIASNELYAEISAKNPKFKKVYENWKPFRNEEILWFRVSENTFDNFMARQSAANKLG
jgi:TRAP-type mannitol/chloroaromatic compound transport system substrate-binding protein